MKGATKITLNSDIDEVIREAKLPMSLTKAFLVCKYLKINTPFVLPRQEKQIQELGLYEEDLAGVTWNVNLFYKEDDIDSFISKYLRIFSSCHPLKGGELYRVKPKILDFMHKHPEYTQEEILDAAERYIKNLENKNFALTCVNFIRNQKGSKLMEYLKAKNKIEI
jgi:hypothetical protein